MRLIKYHLKKVFFIYVCSVFVLSILSSSAIAGWVAKTSGTTEHLEAIHFPDANTGYLVGWLNAVQKTTDGGENWVPKITGIDANDHIYDVQFPVDNTTGFLAANGPDTYKTINGGDLWVKKGAPATSYYQAIHFPVDATTGWTVGWSGVIAKTVDGGETWNPETSPTSEALWGLYFFDNLRGWAVGSNGTIVATTDGSTWFTQTSNVTNTLEDVFFVDANTGFAVGSSGIILKTTDGGSNWVVKTSGRGTSLASVHFPVDSFTGYAAGSSGAVMKTTDGGESWVRQDTGYSTSLADVYFLDNNTGWIVGGSGLLLKTTDGGGTQMVLHPTSNGTTNTFSTATGCATRFECVNDQSPLSGTGAPDAPDDNTSYLQDGNGANGREMFALDNDVIPGGSTITLIEVVAWVRKGSGGSSPDIRLSYERVGTDPSPVDSTLKTLSTTWQTVSYTWSGLSWTTADLNNLEIGLVHDSGGTVEVSQIYVGISYEAGGGGPTTTVGDGTSPSNKTVNPDETNRAVSTFTLSTSSGTDTLTDLTVTRSGTGNDSDVTAVTIYEDKNGDNEYDAGDDPAIASTTLSGGNASFTGLSISISTTQKKYIITYDIATAPGSGNTLLGAVTAATVTTNNPPTINDNNDATLTVTSYCNVTTFTDGIAGSLRNCIQWANGNPGADSIIVPAGTYDLDVDGIGEDASATGDLDIDGDLTITGSGASSTIIDAVNLSPRDRVFHLISGDINIDNLTIREGDAGGNEGGGIFAPSGGASSLTLTDVVITSNNANHGGGIRTSITTTLNDVEVSGNTASFFGGGIRNDISLTWNGGTSSGNNATNGAGIANIAPSGVVDLSNVTLSSNIASGSGGGLYNEKTATLTNVTIYGNTASSGGGIEKSGGATTTVKSSIVANNTGGNCDVATSTNGYNLEATTDTCGFSDPSDLPSRTLPQLNIDNTLKDNGGPTETHALLSGSVAIDVIPSGTNGCGTTVTDDQRGQTRPTDGGGGANCDIGAYEYDPASATTTIGDGTAPANKNGLPSSTNNAVSAFTLSVSTGTDTLTDLTVTLSGTGSAADVAASGVKIYKDVNGDSEWDGGDTLITNGTASFSGSTADFSNLLNESITTTPTAYIITYDLAAGATLTNTLQGEITDATVVTNDPPTENDTVDATLTVSATTTIADGTAPANKAVGISSTNNAVSAFTLATNSGTDTLTDLTVTLSGTGSAADVAASGVKIYKDVNGDSEWDAGDTLITNGTASFSGSTADFSNLLNESINTTPTQYIITYDIDAGATTSNTLLGTVTDATVLTNDPPTITDASDATLTVASICNVDHVEDDGLAGSLRECIKWANGNAGADTIIVPAGTYTITVPGIGEDASATGDLDIANDDLTITGAGMNSTIIDGNGLVINDRVFDIQNSSGTITMSDLTIQDGNIADQGGGILAQGIGLNLTNVAIKNNTGTNGGGIRSIVPVTLTDVEISGNTATLAGGGFRNGDTLIWNGGTLSGNNAVDGAGLEVVGPGSSATLTNVTISSNTATGEGGGMLINTSATLTNVTVYNNSAPTGAGGLAKAGGGGATLENTIVANNTGGNCEFSVTTNGGNLESATNTCSFSDPTDQVNVTAGQLNISNTLAYNGGTTKTHALLSGSFAIDEAVSANCPASDQRGTARGIDGDATPDSPEVGDCDVGAYEYDPAAAVTTIGDGTSPISRDVWAGGRLFGVDVFTTQTSSGTDTLTDLTVTFSGSAVSDVVDGEVRLWKDDGGNNNEWDITDTYIGKAATFDAFDAAKFSGLSEAISTTATRYIITYDINSSASTGNILRGEVTDAAVTNTLVEDDNVDATLTVQADSVHETSIYKAVYSPGSLEELYLKGTSSPLTDTLDSMSLGSLYTIDLTPGSLLITWDPDTTVTTSVDNTAVKQVQMSGRLMHPSGSQYGTADTDITFYEDRIVFDMTITVTANAGAADDWLFMTYGQWESAMSSNFKYSNNAAAFTDEVATFQHNDVPGPFSYQTIFELGATDGLVNATMQNLASFDPAGFKNVDNGGGLSFDVAFQKKVALATYHTSVQYSFDTTAGVLNAALAEERQDDFIDPATMNFGITDGDGSADGDGYVEERGAYTLNDDDADDHVRFQFEPTTTHHAPVFEITGWNSGVPAYIDVGGALKASGTHYNAAVTGTTLYLQYLSTISANTIIEIPSTCPGFVVTTTADSGMGSLRACIDLANSNTGADTISFDIPNTDPGYTNGGSGSDYWWRITLTSGVLPSITNAGTVIDGSTQATNYGSDTNTIGPEIEIFGNAMAGNGITVNNVGSVTVKEIVINSVTGNGVDISGAGASGIYLLGNYIGTNAFGDTDLGNGGTGVYVASSASGNYIGGANPGEGNVISGNNSHGIHILTNNNEILGNRIGTDQTGTAIIPNSSVGIQINGTADTTIVGGQIGGAPVCTGNIISGNGSYGINIGGTAANIDICGNTIGSGVAGTEDLGNTDIGINIGTAAPATNIKIGGLKAGEGNLIAYNGGQGIGTFTSGTGDEIKANTIHDNDLEGIFSGIADLVIEKNLVYNHAVGTRDGIRLAAGSANNTVYHNTVHSNAGDGISVAAAGAIIKNNIITGNGTGGSGYGINVNGGAMTDAYNLITDAATSPVNISGQSNVALDGTTVNADPLYNDEPGDDYTLTECTSPAINMACDLGAAGDDTFCDSAADGAQPDLNGPPAPPPSSNAYNNNAPDMGAYETGNCVPGLTIVKQVWEEGGTAPLGNPTAPVGATLVFLIYVKNTTTGTVSDLRINDDLDEAGFEYVADSLRRTSDSAPPADSATDLVIFNKSGDGTSISLTDATDVAPAEEVASAQDTAGPATVDKITIGAVAAQMNASLSIGPKETFALRFKVKVK